MILGLECFASLFLLAVLLLSALLAFLECAGLNGPRRAEERAACFCFAAALFGASLWVGLCYSVPLAFAFAHRGIL